MIALDTSSVVAYLDGSTGTDVLAVDLALEQHQAVLPPVVLCELLSAPRLPNDARALFEQLPLLDVLDGYWERAGLLRARLLGKRYKARIADALIAQSCLDHDVPLVSRDRDFRHFSKLAALQILE
ncbi:MAG TPA: PIN domain-containing protein [Acidobacteria bacterium]|nr:PIN domain-containing protein [Acidobacteriota bacterium]